MSDISIDKDATNRTLTVERVFDAPRERVWQAWADPEKLAKWFGPRGWETTIKEFEFKPGGIWHYCMTCLDPDQGEYFEQESWGKATYLEIDEPNSFVYRDQFADAAGKPTPGMPTTIVTMSFEPVEGDPGKTRIVSTTVFESDEAYQQVIDMGVIEGLTQTWDRLAEELAVSEV